MIKGKKKDFPLGKKISSIDQIFGVVEEQIINHFLGSRWKVGTAMLSPIPREGKYEKNPSFVIYRSGKKYFFIDFGIGFRGDIIDLIKVLNNFQSNKEVIDFINGSAFSVFASASGNTKTVKSKKSVKIKPLIQEYSEEELNYWKKLYISKEDLIKHNVYSLKKVFINAFPYSPECKDGKYYKFGYKYFEDKWKIYVPYASQKKDRFRSNVPNSFIDTTCALDKNIPALITKSKKDMIVLSKVYNNVYSVQSENIECFTKENVEMLVSSNPKGCVILFDSDLAGKKASEKVSVAFGFSYNYQFLEESNCKDYAEFVEKYGIESLSEMLNKMLQELHKA